MRMSKFKEDYVMKPTSGSIGSAYRGALLNQMDDGSDWENNTKTNLKTRAVAQKALEVIEQMKNDDIVEDFYMNTKKGSIEIEFEMSILDGVFKGVDVSQYKQEDVWAEAANQLVGTWNHGIELKGKYRVSEIKDNFVTVDFFPNHGLLRENKIRKLRESKVEISKNPKISNFRSLIEDELVSKGFQIREPAYLNPKTYCIHNASPNEELIEVSIRGQYDDELWIYLEQLSVGGKIVYVISTPADPVTPSYWVGMSLYDLEKDLKEALAEAKTRFGGVENE